MSTDKVSFWETYPDAEVIGIFRELKRKRGPEKSSDMLWVIHCMMDPENQFMQHLPPKERVEELKKYYNVTDRDISSELFKSSVAWYKKNWISPTRRYLNSLREKIYQGQEYIESFSINSPDDIMMLSELQKAFGVFKKEHDEAENSFKAEGPTRKKLGGEPISAADDGSIFDKL